MYGFIRAYKEEKRREKRRKKKREEKREKRREGLIRNFKRLSKGL